MSRRRLSAQDVRSSSLLTDYIGVVISLVLRVVGFTPGCC
jgi:hypothetical protein